MMKGALRGGPSRKGGLLGAGTRIRTGLLLLAGLVLGMALSLALRLLPPWPPGRLARNVIFCAQRPYFESSAAALAAERDGSRVVGGGASGGHEPHAHHGADGAAAGVAVDELPQHCRGIPYLRQVQCVWAC